MISGRPPCATGDPTTRCRRPSLRCNFRAAIARWLRWSGVLLPEHVVYNVAAFRDVIPADFWPRERSRRHDPPPHMGRRPNHPHALSAPEIGWGLCVIRKDIELRSMHTCANRSPDFILSL